MRAAIKAGLEKTKKLDKDGKTYTVSAYLRGGAEVHGDLLRVEGNLMLVWIGKGATPTHPAEVYVDLDAVDALGIQEL